MRKLLKTILAMSLVMAMGVTAMAAPSISTSYSFNSATDANGNSVNLSIESVSVTAMSNADAAEATGFDADDIAVIWHDIVLDGDATFPLTITLNVTGVTSDMSAKIIHYTSDDEYEVLDATTGSGTVTFTVSSLSPIGVVVEGAATTTAPQTGEFGMTAVMALAVLALGTAFFVSRKKTA